MKVKGVYLLIVGLVVGATFTLVGVVVFDHVAGDDRQSWSEYCADVREPWKLDGEYLASEATMRELDCVNAWTRGDYDPDNQPDLRSDND